MRRLVEELRGSRDELAAEMRQLLEAADPLEPSTASKDRGRRQILARAPGAGRPKRTWVLVAAVAAILVGGSAAARAGLGRWPNWMTAAYDRIVSSEGAQSERSAGRSRQLARPSPRSSGGAESPPQGAAPVEPTAQVGPVEAPNAFPSTVPEGPRRRSKLASPPSAVTTAGRPAAAVGEEKILGAVRALRRDRNPEAARRLLEAYLREQPRGPLVEEAMALRVEAAVAGGDANARMLAAE